MMVADGLENESLLHGLRYPAAPIWPRVPVRPASLCFGNLLCTLLLGVLLAGCAGPAHMDMHYGSLSGGTVELTETPFFVQEAWQCGPAALATVLVDSGVEITPEALVGQVFIPARKGSLQIEMKAATRRFQRLPFPVGSDLASLQAMLAEHRPVLILQNLGWKIFPVWHYAVVVGIEPEQRRVILRSGTERRLSRDFDSFLASWARAGYWGFGLLRPGEIPVHGSPHTLLLALQDYHDTANPLDYLATWQAMQQRWPDLDAAWIGEADALYRGGEIGAAQRVLVALLERKPGSSVALNNLAMLQKQQGCTQQARRTIDQALLYATPALQSALIQSRTEIYAAPAGACASPR